jgi:hypothetical protein
VLNAEQEFMRVKEIGRMRPAVIKDVPLPTEPSEDQCKEITRIWDLKGADFDREFLAYAQKDHERDIEEFAGAAETCAARPGVIGKAGQRDRKRSRGHLHETLSGVSRIVWHAWRSRIARMTSTACPFGAAVVA